MCLLALPAVCATYNIPRQQLDKASSGNYIDYPSDNVTFNVCNENCTEVSTITIQNESPSKYLKEDAQKMGINIITNNGSTTNQSGSSSNGPTGDESDPLYKAMLSKTIKNSLCVKDLGSTAEDKSGDCAYINQIYGICDTHAYNHGVSDNNGDSTLREDIKNTVALKITVISQQMYKQYEYLSSTLRRLKTQLQKSVLTAQLEKAGADSGGSGSGGSSNKNSTYTNCSGKGPEDTLYCLRQNYSALQSKIGNKQCGKDEKKQLETDIDIMNGFAGAELSGCKQTDLTSRDKCSTCLGTYNIGIMKFQDYIDDRAAKRSGNYRY